MNRALLLFSGVMRLGAALFSLVALAACTLVPAERPSRDVAQVPALTQAIMGLGPEVDAEEAARAARIAYAYTDELALAYRITDPPLVHNAKVNMGLKPRGLCWHWAEDMERRLLDENFETLELHRAIANHDKIFRIEHSTAIIARRGDVMEDGIVLDPWRKGGILTWMPVSTDPDYDWVPNYIVHALKRERAAGRAAKSVPLTPPPLAMLH